MSHSIDASRQSDATPEVLSAVRPCAKCGTAERYKDGACKVCRRAIVARSAAKNPEKKKAQSASWYAANSERIKALHAEWKKANPEKTAAYLEAAIEAKGGKADYLAWRANKVSYKAAAKAWREKNRDKKKAASEAWNAENPERRRLSNQNRRARKKAAGGQLSRDLTVNLFKLQKGKCPCCKQPLGDDFHLDHIVPLALGGTNTDDNIQLLRALCNMQKNAKHPIAFMQERGFLL